MNGLQNDLPIVLCKDAEDAVERGYNYRRPEYLPARINQAVVVLNGTESGRATVDFVMEDEKGQKHVVMLTARLLQVLAETTK